MFCNCLLQKKFHLYKMVLGIELQEKKPALENKNWAFHLKTDQARYISFAVTQ